MVFTMSADSFVFKKFTDFVAKYNKSYPTVEAFNHAYENFQNNLQEVVLADDFSGSHTKSITKFSDLSKEEFKTQYLTLKAPQAGYCQQTKKNLKAKPVPATQDYRTNGWVSPVKDQGQCGSCWAFSTIAHLESTYLRVNDGKISKNVTFSEQQLVDCDTGSDAGCNGGLMQTAFEYIQANGIESDDDYPYTAEDGTCTSDESKYLVSVDNITCQEDITDDVTKALLIQYGPLAIAVDATSFQSYDSGILECESQGLDHGVLLIGWGANYWIVKNSWGANWGENGFVRVSTDADKNCMIGAYVVTADIK